MASISSAAKNSIERNLNDIASRLELNLERSSESANSFSFTTREPCSSFRFPLNCILYGAPGTGKTYSTAELAISIIEDTDYLGAKKTKEERAEIMRKYNAYISNHQIVFTTFHQSYGYEDFVQGLRPESKDGVLNFVPVDGVFKTIAERAMPDQPSFSFSPVELCFSLRVLGCLEAHEVWKYADGKTIYGWHISKLEIYDEPKSIRDFTPCCDFMLDEKQCDYRKVECLHQQDSFLEEDGCNCLNFVNRPSQSFCYVEELT